MLRVAAAVRAIFRSLPCFPFYFIFRKILFISFLEQRSQTYRSAIYFQWYDLYLRPVQLTAKVTHKHVEAAGNELIPITAFPSRALI